MEKLVMYYSDIRAFSAESLGSAKSISALRIKGLATLSFPLLKALDSADLRGNDDLRDFSMPLIERSMLVVGEPCSAMCLDSLGNKKLVDFDLRSLVAGTVSFYDNRSLPQCKVDALASRIQASGMGGKLTSGQNSPACPSP
jgi:hypothetical protein